MKLLMENVIYIQFKVSKIMLAYYFVLIWHGIHYTASSLMTTKVRYFKEKQVIVTIIFHSLPIFIYSLLNLFVCLFSLNYSNILFFFFSTNICQNMATMYKRKVRHKGKMLLKNL